MVAGGGGTVVAVAAAVGKKRRSPSGIASAVEGEADAGPPLPHSASLSASACERTSVELGMGGEEGAGRREGFEDEALLRAVPSVKHPKVE